MATEPKREPVQPEWPKQDRKIFRRCISRSPYKPQAPSVWTRSPCYGVSPRPIYPGDEGAYAIKVSMTCYGDDLLLLYSHIRARASIPCLSNQVPILPVTHTLVSSLTSVKCGLSAKYNKLQRWLY